MAKQLNDIKPVGDDDDDVPELDMSKSLGTQANGRIFGKVGLPDEGRQVAKPINLDFITPDPTQPRREVPPIVRKRAREDGVAEWQMWHQMAERQAGHEIPLKALLRGEGEGDEHEKTGMPLVDGFMALVALAASIHEKGLVNPITVSPRGMDHYMIETGERRYQAYKLLYGVLGHKKYSKIVANTVEQVDVWRQAAENGSRKPLNAIGMARQIALLIMALNTDKDYAPFESFEGKSDRAFYAQVADGNTHRIPKGESEKILQATGLKSRTQIAQYRALLDVDDKIWETADEDDWTENRIRETVRPANHTLTAVNVSAPSTDAYGRPVHPPMTVRKGEGPGTKVTRDKVLYRGEVVEYHDSDAKGVANGFNVLIMHFDKNEIRTFSEIVHSRDIKDLPHPDAGKPTGGHYSPLTPGPSPTRGEGRQDAPFVAPKITYDAIGPNTATRLEVGQRRMNSSGRIIEILSILANDVAYAEISPATGRPMGRFVMTIAYAASLPIVSKDVLPNPQVPFEDDEAADEETVEDTRLSGPDMPEGGWKPGMQVVTFAGKKGTVTSINGRDVYIETRDGERVKCFEGNMRLLSAREIEKEQSAQTVDNPLSTEPESSPLPDWAQRGKTIIHTPSGTVCEVVATVVDAIEDRWYLRCKTGDGEWGDLRLDECGPYVPPPAEPRPRHPGMDPKNMTRVVTEAQFDFGQIWNMATDYKMPSEASQIGKARTSTPAAVFTFLQEDGYEGAAARIEAMYQALCAPLQRAQGSADTWYAEMIELLNQKAAETQGA